MAREVGDIADAVGYSPVYIARNQTELADWNYLDEVILEEQVLRYHDIPFVIGIGDNCSREKLFKYYVRNLIFLNLIHPSATFGKGQREQVEGMQGVIICAGVRLTCNISIGNCCIFNQNVAVAHDCVIDDFVHIAPGGIISGNVHIGARSWIGAGAVVNQGGRAEKLYIGMDTVIGSGAVVLKNCDVNSVYVGVPAKKIK